MIGSKRDIPLALPTAAVSDTVQGLAIDLRTLVPGHHHSTGGVFTPFIDAARHEIVGYSHGDTAGTDPGGILYRCPLTGSRACTETALHLATAGGCASARSAFIDVPAARVFVVEATMDNDGDDEERVARLLRCPLDGRACTAPVELARARKRSPHAGLPMRPCDADRFSLRGVDGRVVVRNAAVGFSCEPDAMTCAPMAPDPSTKTTSGIDRPSFDVVACDAEGRSCGETMLHAPAGLTVEVVSAIANKGDQHVFALVVSKPQSAPYYVQCSTSGCRSLALSPLLIAIQFPKIDPNGGVWAVAWAETVEGHPAPSRVVHCLPAPSLRCVVLQPSPALPDPQGIIEILFFEGLAHLLFVDDHTLGIVDASFPI